MLNQENKNLITTYVLTLIIVGLLIFVIMKFNAWFPGTHPGDGAEFTPASRGVISQNDLKLGLFNDAKFRSLGPLLSPEEMKRLEAEERASTPSGQVSGTVTGTAKPPVVIKREVRHDNPFIPF